MIKSLAYIFLFQFLGEGVSALFDLPVPGNVIGMVLLTLALSLKFLKPDDLKEGADLLLRNLAFLFVPPGVGLMLYFDLIRSNWLSIGASFLLSTFAVLTVVGWVQQGLERK